MYRDIDDIKQAHRVRGGYFFEPKTMRWFHSRTLPTVYGGRYFITSEQRESYTPRNYTVRECVEGEINTVGKFNDIEELSEAKRIARELAAQLQEQPQEQE